MTVPQQPKIYHIVHVDRLRSIIHDEHLWCDAKASTHMPLGTSIGMSTIKRRRLYELRLTSYPNLHVGDCVPFYFCPRSIMLYMIFRANHPELEYRGGQGPIIHMEADLFAAIAWAQQNTKRWAFTLSNAGAYYFEDRCTLAQLHEINWDAVYATQWSGKDIQPTIKEGKQAEFLMEHEFPWHLIERIGVSSPAVYQQVVNALPIHGHRPKIEVKREWYY